MKRFIQIFIIVVLFSSCKQSVFLNRKYTSGKFTENNKILKYNTVYIDTTKNYASVNVIPNISIVKVVETEKEITEQKINCMFSKKDTIIRLKRIGPDKEMIIKNKSSNVCIVVDGIPKPSSPQFKEKIKQNSFSYIKIKTILSLAFSLVPVVGLVMALACKKALKKFQLAYNENLETQRNITTAALGISILPTLATALIVLAFITLIVFLFFGPGMSVLAPLP